MTSRSSSSSSSGESRQSAESPSMGRINVAATARTQEDLDEVTLQDGTVIKGMQYTASYAQPTEFQTQTESTLHDGTVIKNAQYTTSYAHPVEYQAQVTALSPTAYYTQNAPQKSTGSFAQGLHIPGQYTPHANYNYMVNQGAGRQSGYMNPSRIVTQKSATSVSRNADGQMGRQTRLLTGGETVLSERVVEHEVKVPKRIVREEIVEKIIVVPEKIIHEMIIEETMKVREKIIEVSKPVYQEKIVEVPEIQYAERVVEVPEKVIQEKIIEVPRVEIQERIIEVPKIIIQERIVEVPDIEYREVPVEKIVEVPDIREQIVIKEVSVPQYVDKPVAQHVTVQVAHKVERNIPVPVEAVSTFEYRLPHIRPHYKKASFPIYLPRFVEVPVPEELVSGAVGKQAAHLAQHVSLLTTQAAPSLCEIENIAADIKKIDLARHIASSDYYATIQQSWAEGKLTIGTYGEASGMLRAASATGGDVQTVPPSANMIPVVFDEGSTTRHRSKKNHTKSIRSNISHKVSGVASVKSRKH